MDRLEVSPELCNESAAKDEEPDRSDDSLDTLGKNAVGGVKRLEYFLAFEESSWDLREGLNSLDCWMDHKSNVQSGSRCIITVNSRRYMRTYRQLKETDQHSQILQYCRDVLQSQCHLSAATAFVQAAAAMCIINRSLTILTPLPYNMYLSDLKKIVVHFSHSSVRYYSSCILYGLEFMRHRQVQHGNLTLTSIALDQHGRPLITDFDPLLSAYLSDNATADLGHRLEALRFAALISALHCDNPRHFSISHMHTASNDPRKKDLFNGICFKCRLSLPCLERRGCEACLEFCKLVRFIMRRVITRDHLIRIQAILSCSWHEQEMRYAWSLRQPGMKPVSVQQMSYQSKPSQLYSMRLSSRTADSDEDEEPEVEGAEGNRRNRGSSRRLSNRMRNTENLWMDQKMLDAASSLSMSKSFVLSMEPTLVRESVRASASASPSASVNSSLLLPNMSPAVSAAVSARESKRTSIPPLPQEFGGNVAPDSALESAPISVQAASAEDESERTPGTDPRQEPVPKDAAALAQRLAQSAGKPLVPPRVQHLLDIGKPRATPRRSLESLDKRHLITEAPARAASTSSSFAFQLGVACLSSPDSGSAWLSHNAQKSAVHSETDSDPSISGDPVTDEDPPQPSSPQGGKRMPERPKEPYEFDGYQQLMHHDYFRGISWSGLETGQCPENLWFAHSLAMQAYTRESAPAPVRSAADPQRDGAEHLAGVNFLVRSRILHNLFG